MQQILDHYTNPKEKEKKANLRIEEIGCSEGYVGEKVKILCKISNIGELKVSCAVLFYEILGGETNLLKRENITLKAGEEINLSIDWIAEKSGIYTIKAEIMGSFGDVEPSDNQRSVEVEISDEAKKDEDKGWVLVVLVLVLLFF